jgi:hypothetical protein
MGEFESGPEVRNKYGYSPGLHLSSVEQLLKEYPGGWLICCGDDVLCGLVGRDSRLSKLALWRNSGGVDCPVDVGRRIGDEVAGE